MEELHITHTVVLPEAHPPLRDALSAVAEDLGSTIKLAIQKAQEGSMNVQDVSARLLYDENNEYVFVRITLCWS